MIRDTIDVYLSCIDRRKVHLVFQLWLISFFTAMAGVAFTASGYEPWGPLTFLAVWLAFYVTLEGLATLGATVFSFWVAGRELQQMAAQMAGEQSQPALWSSFLHAERFSLHAPGVYREDPDGFWDDLPDDEEAPHD